MAEFYLSFPKYSNSCIDDLVPQHLSTQLNYDLENEIIPSDQDYDFGITWGFRQADPDLIGWWEGDEEMKMKVDLSLNTGS